MLDTTAPDSRSRRGEAVLLRRRQGVVAPLQDGCRCKEEESNQLRADLLLARRPEEQLELRCLPQSEPITLRRLHCPLSTLTSQPRPVNGQGHSTEAILS